MTVTPDDPLAKALVDALTEREGVNKIVGGLAEWHDKHDVKALDDDCYPIVYMRVGADATPEQKAAAFRKWKQNDQDMTWAEFFHTAEHTFGCDGAIAIKWCDMWLCIEEDGYCHT